jgi:hypothetical protein
VNEPGDELVAALKLVGDLLRKSAGEDLKSLLAGDSKLVIVPKAWRPTPPRTPTTRQRVEKVEIPTASVVRSRLLEATDSLTRVALLSSFKMNATQARKLAKDLGVNGAQRSTPDEAIEKIAAYFADSTSPVSVRGY